VPFRDNVGVARPFSTSGAPVIEVDHLFALLAGDTIRRFETGQA
jgi:hypothetical protein